MSEQGYQPHPLRTAVASHVGGGTPSRQVPSYWRGQIPWASVKDFPEQSGVIDDTEEHISTSGLNASASNLIPAGTPLVCTRMAVGRAAMPSATMAINQDVKALFPAPGVSPAYLLKLLQFIQPKAEAQAVGSTVKGIRIQDYLDIKVPIADREAQPVIALVLDTLDTAIHKTETIIAKLKAVKRGLLHDLLTRGIAANGELRPPQFEAPHLYKESPLGWIPQEWDVSALSGLGTDGLINGVFKEPERVGSGVPLVNVADLYRGESVSLNECEHFAATDLERSRYSARHGDIFFTRSSLKLEGIAQTSFLAEKTDSAVFECHVMRLRPNISKVAPRFLKEWCVGSYARKHFMANAKQVTMTTISQDGIAGLPCPRPSLSEQTEAVRRMESVDARLNNEVLTAKKLRAEKQALMDDLLIGRVRVTPLLAEAAQQHGSA